MADAWQEQAATWYMGDFDSDGTVDAADAAILAGNWTGSGETTAGSVPEPSTLALLALAVACVAAVRRGR